MYTHLQEILGITNKAAAEKFTAELRMVQQSLADATSHSHTMSQEDETGESDHLDVEANTEEPNDDDEILTIHVFGVMMAQELYRTAQALTDKHVSMFLCECMGAYTHLYICVYVPRVVHSTSLHRQAYEHM
jgi:hypothetical protein